MKRMTKWWPALALAGTFGVGVLSCGEDTLLKIDVDGDSPYSSVQLRLAVKGTSVQQSFGNASFGPAVIYKAGLYGSDSGGNGIVTGEASQGTCVLGTGTVTIRSWPPVRPPRRRGSPSSNPRKPAPRMEGRMRWEAPVEA